MPVNAVSHGEAPLKHSAMLETEGGFTALLDTGAGPSLITKSALTRIDPEYVIQPDSNVYTTANGQTMAIYGRVENVPIEVKGHKLPFPAVVVEKLPDEDIILGRDFITMYDILIDIPRRGILISNTERKYEFMQLIEEDVKASPYIGKPTRVEYIEGESTKETEYRVRPLRKNDKCNNDLSCWLGVVYKDESHSERIMQAGICLPNSVVKVSGDKTKIALLNAKPALSTAEKDAIELEPDDFDGSEDPAVQAAIGESEVKIHPVRVVYKRDYELKGEQPPEQDQIRISLLENEISVIRVNERKDPTSDFSSANESELPIALPEQKATAFPTRPDIKSCRDM